MQDKKDIKQYCELGHVKISKGKFVLPMERKNGLVFDEHELMCLLFCIEELHKSTATPTTLRLERQITNYLDKEDEDNT